MKLKKISIKHFVNLSDCRSPLLFDEFSNLAAAKYKDELGRELNVTLRILGETHIQNNHGKDFFKTCEFPPDLIEELRTGQIYESKRYKVLSLNWYELFVEDSHYNFLSSRVLFQDISKMSPKEFERLLDTAAFNTYELLTSTLIKEEIA